MDITQHYNSYEPLDNPELMNLEANFYGLLNTFNSVYNKYYDLIFRVPINLEDKEALSKLFEGLKILSESFSNLPEAYRELCSCKGVEI